MRNPVFKIEALVTLYVEAENGELARQAASDFMTEQVRDASPETLVTVSQPMHLDENEAHIEPDLRYRESPLMGRLFQVIDYS